MSEVIRVAGLALPVIAPIVAVHFHSALRNSKARKMIIERLLRGHWQEIYHDWLEGLLVWLDRKIDPPPLARDEEEKRVWGVRSLNVCLGLSLTYSVAAFLGGWVAGSPGSIGDIVLLELAAEPGHFPAVWLRVGVAALFCLLGLFFWWYIWTAMPWIQRRIHGVRKCRKGLATSNWRAIGDRALRFLIVTAVIIAATAVAGAAVGLGLAIAMALGVAGAVGMLVGVAVAIGAAVANGAIGTAGAIGTIGATATIGAVAGGLANEPALVMLLFFALLPIVNGLLDWISLNVSRWLGLGIVAHRELSRPGGRVNLPTSSKSAPQASLRWILGLAVADLVFAVVFLLAITWLLAFGIEGLGAVFGLSLELETYVGETVTRPWSQGLWASFMVVSTLFPTAVHFGLALGALLFAWARNPLHGWAADRLASGNEADFLGPQLYLTFGWLVPAVLAPVLLLWGLSGLFELVSEPLPRLLEDTALQAIRLARAWLV